MIKHPYSKIALVGDMLGEGGAERVQARLSVFFEEHGVEVHHIIFAPSSSITYKNIFIIIVVKINEVARS